jgi:alkanesulfonate monooxygenase
MELHWNIIAQDGPYPWSLQGQRVTDLAYLRQIAGATEQAGFDGALLATVAGGADPWGLATHLAASTRRMKFIVAQYAGVIAPLWLAQMAASLDQASDGRAVINIITGGDHNAQALGNFLDHDDRYALADEYWGVFRRIMAGERVDFVGKHIRVRGAQLMMNAVQPRIELMFGGSSPAALQIAAKHCDTWLTLGLPPPQVAEKIAAVRMLADAQGRRLRYGVRLHVIVRETEAEAWRQAQWLYDHMDRPAIERHMARMRNIDAEKVTGQAEMARLADLGAEPPEDARAFEVYPHLWSGIGLVRIGPGTAIVGDPGQVVDMLRQYEAAGAEVFILSGYPHIEEAYRFADLVMPRLRDTYQAKRATWL